MYGSLAFCIWFGWQCLMIYFGKSFSLIMTLCHFIQIWYWHRANWLCAPVVLYMVKYCVNVYIICGCALYRNAHGYVYVFHWNFIICCSLSLFLVPSSNIHKQKTAWQSRIEFINSSFQLNRIAKLLILLFCVRPHHNVNPS